MDPQRQGEAVWRIQLLLAAFPVPRVREVPWDHSWTCGPALNPSIQGCAVLSQSTYFVLGLKTCFPTVCTWSSTCYKAVCCVMGFCLFLKLIWGFHICWCSANNEMVSDFLWPVSSFWLVFRESCFSGWPQHKAIAVPFLSFHLLGYKHPVASSCSQARKISGDCTVLSLLPLLSSDDAVFGSRYFFWSFLWYPGLQYC